MRGAAASPCGPTIPSSRRSNGCSRASAANRAGSDVLVNDVWGGDALTEWFSPFWELSTAQGLALLERAVHSHVITSRHGVPLMVERNAGLVVEVTDGDTLGYRGNLLRPRGRTRSSASPTRWPPTCTRTG